MSRVPRRFQYSESGCYHILNRGHNRETVFWDERDFEMFLGLLGRYQERYGFRLFHYCLMSNHFHLLLQLPEPRSGTAQFRSWTTNVQRKPSGKNWNAVWRTALQILTPSFRGRK